MAFHAWCSVHRLAAPVGIALYLATATVVHAQIARPEPPYLQANVQLISVGVAFNEAAVRAVLPSNVTPAPGFTGGINIYQAPAGYPLAPYSAAYVWVDVEGYDSPQGAKGRWMLQGLYGPEPVPAAVRDNLGLPVRAGASRFEATEGGSRAVGLLGDREVLSVEIKSSRQSCVPIKGVINYLGRLGPSQKLGVTEIPFVGEACSAQATNVSIKATEGDALNALAPTRVLWARELKNFTFVFSRPKPVE